MKPVTQPVDVGGTAVVMATRNKHLYVVGIDPARGKLLWSREAAPDADPPGIAVSIEKVSYHGRPAVAYFAPGDSDSFTAQIVVADPKTGSPLEQSPVAWMYSFDQCTDGPGLCGMAVIGYGTYAPYRFDPNTGTLAQDKTALAPNSRAIGDHGLIDLGDRHPEKIGVARRGKIRWSAPLSRYFGDGYSTDNGWTFDKIGPLFVGTVGNASTSASLAGDATAAFNAATGRPRWRVAHTAWTCWDELHGSSSDQPVPVRCRYSHPLKNGSVSVTAEGFNPTTGATTWRFPLGRDMKFVTGEQQPAVAGRNTVMMQQHGKPIVLDLTSGATRAPQAGEVFLCSSHASFTYHQKWTYHGTGTRERQGDNWFRACSAHGARPSGRRLPSAAALTSLDQTYGPVVVISQRRAVVGYRVG